MSPETGPEAWAQDERVALSDTLVAVGPDAPTMCTGWDARLLAAHLVMRDRRPDALPGIAVPALAGHTDRVQRSIARRPFADLVHDVRTGPGISLFRLPGLSGTPALLEYVVHHEDLRRAQPDWTPRPLAPEVEDKIWSALRSSGRMLYRKASAGVVLRRENGESARVRPGQPTAIVTGPPLELLLYAFGRRSVALVEAGGDAEAARNLAEIPLGA
jgi:uncharacterized protein (TIGR03085 family)